MYISLYSQDFEFSDVKFSLVFVANMSPPDKVQYGVRVRFGTQNDDVPYVSMNARGEWMESGLVHAWTEFLPTRAMDVLTRQIRTETGKTRFFDPSVLRSSAWSEFSHHSHQARFHYESE